MNWDGKLLGCCVNYWGDFGSNVFLEGLEKSTANSTMQRARRMLTGEEAAAPDVPCSTCHQYAGLCDSGQWLTREEIESYARPKYIVSLNPIPHGRIRFAQIGVTQADTRGQNNGAPSFGVSGRIFRFGIDSAVFCSVPSPGEYRAEVRALTSDGWQRLTYPFTVDERPVCQELVIDFKHCVPAAREEHGNTKLTWLPCWIC